MSWMEGLLGRPPRDQPSEPPRGDPQQVAEVSAALDELRPFIEADGGAIDLLAIEDGWVELRLRGACRGCASSDLTVRGAVEPRLRQRCPWIAGVRVS